MKKFFYIFLITICLSGCMPGSNIKDEREVTQGTGYKNTKIQWGLKKEIGASPQIPSSWNELLKRFDGYYLGDTTQKILYITFDEGYENGYTAQILDVLKEKKVPAAFFITGPYLSKQEDLVKRMVNEGHIVGNHTVNHPSMPEVLNDEKLENELNVLNENFFKLTGQKMKYVRPPKGELSERTLAISQKLGYKTILWSSAYVDWNVKDKSNSKQRAIEQITKYFHNGSIILLHAVSKENADVLPEVIDIAVNQGYSFKSLDDL